MLEPLSSTGKRAAEGLASPLSLLPSLSPTEKLYLCAYEKQHQNIIPVPWNHPQNPNYNLAASFMPPIPPKTHSCSLRQQWLQVSNLLKFLPLLTKKGEEQHGERSF